MSLHFHPLTVKQVIADTDEAVIVSFDVPAELRDTFRFDHGQYLTLRREVDGQDLRRSYSICAGVDDDALRVGIRKVAGGVFSGWVNDHLKPGDRIEVIPPQGHFTTPLTPDGPGRHLVGIAGGSGITPILSIIKTVLAREPATRFTLIYGNRRQRSTMFLEEIEDLKNRYLSRLVIHHLFSQEQLDNPLSAGRLSRDKLAEFFTSPPGGQHGPLIDPTGIDQVFICGPHGVNDEAEAALLSAGVAPERLHIERFGVPPDATGVAARPTRQEGDAALARITIIRDGIQRDVDYHAAPDGEVAPSILEAAGAAGLEVPFSCKSGVCCTCRAKLLEGQVRMDRNFALEKHEVAAGFVLTCQSHPLTERVVLSFDER